MGRFMQPSDIGPAGLLELWGSPEFAQAEVSFLCTVRSAFIDAGGSYFYAKPLELGGMLRPVSELVEAVRGKVLASSYPRAQNGVPRDVLVHAAWQSLVSFGKSMLPSLDSFLFIHIEPRSRAGPLRCSLRSS